MSQKGKEKCWISTKSVSPRGAKQCTRSREAGICPILLQSLWTSGLTSSDSVLLLFWSHLGLLSFLAIAIDPRTPTHKVMFAERCPSAHHHLLLASHLSGWFHTSAVSPYRGSVLLWAEARHLSALLLSQDLVGHRGYLLSPRVSTAKSTTELGWASIPFLWFVSAHQSAMSERLNTPLRISLSKGYALSCTSFLSTRLSPTHFSPSPSFFHSSRKAFIIPYPLLPSVLGLFSNLVNKEVLTTFSYN